MASSSPTSVRHSRKPSSWKERLAKKLSGGDYERERDRKPSPPLSEDWFVIDGPAMEAAIADHTDGNAVSSPSSSRRKTSSKVATASPLVGAKSASIKSSSSRGEAKLPRPSSPGTHRVETKPPRPSSPHGSPSGVHRKTGGSTRSGRDRLEVHHNGKASPRSVSPSRSSTKRKGGRSGSPSPGSSSPVGDSHRDHKDHREKEPREQANHLQVPKPTESILAKARDTLRISKAKKQQKSASKQYAVQYSAPEINLHTPPSKYQDPFEASQGFGESVEEHKAGQGHDFKAVSIPHNKPEYCDHCGETAWGLYRQVLKCSSKPVCGVCVSSLIKAHQGCLAKM